MNKKRLEQIIVLLAEVDPINLCDVGAPDDEYSPEAKLIEEHLSKNGFVDLEQVVEDVFLQMFDETLPDEVVKEIVRRINSLQNN